MSGFTKRTQFSLINDLFIEAAMKSYKPTNIIRLRWLATILAGMLMTHNSDAQSWYNAYWQYRTTVMVNNSGGELNDFQVQLVLDSEFPWSHVTEDGRDIRFTASDGQTELPYWIEQWNHGTGASVWVRVNSIAASPSATTLYLYYGNETATCKRELTMYKKWQIRMYEK